MIDKIEDNPKACYKYTKNKRVTRERVAQMVTKEEICGWGERYCGGKFHLEC